MKFHLVMAGLAALAMVSAPVRAQTPDPAQAPDPRALDAVLFFTGYCVTTGGKRDKALAVLGDGNMLAKRLSDDIVQQAQGGREGGVGWAVRSPNNAEIMLDYWAIGMCGVRLREADEETVVGAFEAVMNALVAGTGAELARVPAEVQTVDGVRTTYRAYSFPFGGRTAHLGLTTAERPVGEQQHFMTFSFVK